MKRGCVTHLFSLPLFQRFLCKQSPKKSKKEKEKEEVVIALEDLSPLAHPLAQKKLVKKLHKTIKKGLSCICGQAYSR